MNLFGFLLAFATLRKACMLAIYSGDRLSVFMHCRFIYIIISAKIVVLNHNKQDKYEEE
jgi:hypothetical protein